MLSITHKGARPSSLTANEPVEKAPTTKKVYKLGVPKKGTSIRDRRLKAKYGGRFFCKFFDLPFSTASTFSVSGISTNGTEITRSFRRPLHATVIYCCQVYGVGETSSYTPPF